MSLIKKLKPDFLEHHAPKKGPYRHMFNFVRIWKMTVVLISVVTLLPLISITLIDYNVTQKSINSGILLRTGRVASNTKRSISFFLSEHKSALDFIVHDNKFIQLTDLNRLSEILGNLKTGFGGFVDLGVVNSEGIQIAYVGEYNLAGYNYSEQAWFKKVINRGVYISDVFMGFRNTPHFVIAVKYRLPDNSFYILRTTIDTDNFNNLLSNLELSGKGDAFVINKEGVIQTPSRSHGNVLEKILIKVPEYSDRTEVIEYKSRNSNSIIVGYAYIPETNFILMIAKQKNELMKSWYETRSKLIMFLIASISIILGVILWLTTYLVNNMHLADKKRVMAMHRIEYDNSMASIGRLAAGVAHEINNPLAIINEKAGLIKDIFTFNHAYSPDNKLMELVSSIIYSVERCGAITKRLLGFARHLDVSIQAIDIEKVIRDVLGFMGKEAEYRSIAILVDVPDDFPPLIGDRGKLQQILLNLVNNAFSAISSDEGKLDIRVVKNDDEFCSIIVTDNGCGIPENELQLIFEPFFTKKSAKGGTGLGLSITYGLVQEAGGIIDVKSTVGKGTSFIITLPFKTKTKWENN